MVRQPVRFALLLGAISAMAVSTARANHGSSSACCNAPAPACSAPCTRTIQVTECVPETYTVKRTAYKVECRTEEYDTFRCENVWEERERTVTCYKRVPVTTWETRKVCKHVTTYEDRMVTRTTYKTVQETVMQKRLVRLGHWENYEVTRPDFLGGLRGAFSGLGCGHHGCGNSCDPCASSCNNSCAPACRTVCRKKWVYCPQYECCPVTVCKKVACCEQVCCKVAVCKPVWCEEKVQVCRYQCVPETRCEKYKVCVTRKVPCKATRTVRVCVPYEECVTCTRMVRRTVCKEVPVNDCCNNACGNSCCGFGFDFGGRLRGLLSKPGKGGCCDTACSSSCGGCR